jgi:hypothetical protein
MWSASVPSNGTWRIQGLEEMRTASSSRSQSEFGRAEYKEAPTEEIRQNRAIYQQPKKQNPCTQWFNLKFKQPIAFNALAHIQMQAARMAVYRINMQSP